jgi:hypothetical protein
MSAGRIFAALLIVALSCELVVRADDAASRRATNVVATNAIGGADLPLTNKAVLVISKLRGVEPSQVAVRAGRRAGGAFEIDLSGARDGRHEAQELSKELGAAATVIFEHVSGDGVLRTNWSFRDGTGRQVTAPAGPTGLGPNAKRLYVWPQSSARPSPPQEIRVREKE